MDQSDPSCLHCDASLRDHPLMARIARLEAALRRARPYVLNHEFADAAELEACGLTLHAIDAALGSVQETEGEQ